MHDPSTMVRWLRFNAVGLAGVVVQLGCLVALTRGAGFHYLPATLLAVEVAVIHNFAWHQRWTWRDRPVAGRRGLALRFARFQALNGAISLAVNSGAMIALAGVAGLDPLLAGLVAVAGASVVNYVASDMLVFDQAAVTPPSRSRTPGAGAHGPRDWTRAMMAGLLVLAPLPVLAGEQGPAAAAAWTRYQAEVDARYHAAGTADRPFFVLDRVSDGADWRRQVLHGGIAMRQIEPPDVEDARIHHWTGAVFIPGTSVAKLIARLQQNAGQEARFYDDVVDSRLLARDGDRLRVFMKLRRTTVITATFNTEHDVEYRMRGPARASSRSVAVKIAELADAGTARERERAAGDDRGFLWRLNAYWRFEQAGDGVIVECESVSLSRSVPALLRPVAGPVVTRVARESLHRTLAQLAQSLIPHR